MLAIHVQEPHLIVNDRSRGRWERNGSDTANKVSNVCPALQLRVSRKRPHNGVDEVTRDILLQLLRLRGNVCVRVRVYACKYSIAYIFIQIMQLCKYISDANFLAKSFMRMCTTTMLRQGHDMESSL